MLVPVLLLLLLLLPATCTVVEAAPPVPVPVPCAVLPWVDRFVGQAALDASTTPLLGWQLSSGCRGLQTAYELEVVGPGGGTVWQSGLVAGGRSDGVRYSGPTLGAAARYGVRVRATLNATTSTRLPRPPARARATTTGWSPVVPFVTGLGPGQLGPGAATPFWHANASARFVLLRRRIPASAAASQLFLSLSAKPQYNWYGAHPVAHLFCAYKLWVDGEPLAAGPGRPIGGNILVDTFNITGGRSVAVAAYYYTPAQPGHAPDRGGVFAYAHDGQGTVAFQGPAGWEAFDATAATRPTAKPFPSTATHGPGCGTHDYHQAYENIDGSLFPFGWQAGASTNSTATAATGWSPAARRESGGFASPLAPKHGAPVAMFAIQAQAVHLLPSLPNGRYRYLVDFGTEIQGHINFTFSPATTGDGSDIVVRLGEELLANGSAKFHSSSENVWTQTFTLPASAGGGGAAAFVPHEYVEFRYAEVLGDPEAPSLDRLRGWTMRYPLGKRPEQGLAARDEHLWHPTPRPPPPPPTLVDGSNSVTRFSSDSAPLSAVWGLAVNTALSGPLAQNTDSNTRQRDLCTLDAWLATTYQAGMAPATSCHLRHAVAALAWDQAGYVNYWTEFLVAHVFAVADYAREYGDVELARLVWNVSAVGLNGRDVFTRHNYSLEAYLSPATGLVTGSPRPLIDWPRSPFIDITGQAGATLCKGACVEMNAYGVLALSDAALLATAVGDDAEAKRLSALADRVRAASRAAFPAKASACTPPVGPCYLDAAPGGPSNTTAQATATAAFAGLPASPLATLQLVPFLRARNARNGLGLEVSGWMAGFMMRGLYAACGPEGAPGPGPAASSEALALLADAADFCFADVLTASKNNSWLGMLRQGATMTMESWVQEPGEEEGGGTYSHPWNNAPSFVVPRLLAGVRPLAPGWARVLVAPVPPRADLLSRFSLRVPTLRGIVELNYTHSGGASVTLGLSLPANTAAQVCLPRYLFPAAAACHATLDGAAAPTVTLNLALCLAQDVVGGGAFAVGLACAGGGGR